MNNTNNGLTLATLEVIAEALEYRLRIAQSGAYTDRQRADIEGALNAVNARIYPKTKKG